MLELVINRLKTIICVQDMTSVEKVVDIKPVKRKPQLYTNLKRSLNGDSGSEQENMEFEI